MTLVSSLTVNSLLKPTSTTSFTRPLSKYIWFSNASARETKTFWPERIAPMSAQSSNIAPQSGAPRASSLYQRLSPKIFHKSQDQEQCLIDADLSKLVSRPLNIKASSTIYASATHSSQLCSVHRSRIPRLHTISNTWPLGTSNFSELKVSSWSN